MTDSDRSPSRRAAQGPAPDSVPARPGVRRAIDALVHGATVELFHFYGIGAAPVRMSELRGAVPSHHDPVATIRFHAPGFEGEMSISAESGVIALAQGDKPSDSNARDWCREMANQLMGKIKVRLLRFQVDLRVELPGIGAPESLRIRTRPRLTRLWYPFRTVRGEVLVSLQGQFDESRLVFTNAVQLPAEGKLVLF